MCSVLLIETPYTYSCFCVHITYCLALYWLLWRLLMTRYSICVTLCCVFFPSFLSRSSFRAVRYIYIYICVKRYVRYGLYAYIYNILFVYMHMNISHTWLLGDVRCRCTIPASQRKQIDAQNENENERTNTHEIKAPQKPIIHFQATVALPSHSHRRILKWELL